MLKGDYAAALQGYIDFAKVFPNNNGVHFWMALALWGLGREDESTQTCAQALALTQAVSDVEEALADLDDFVVTHPELPVPARLRALLLDWLKHREGSVEHGSTE